MWWDVTGEDPWIVNPGGIYYFGAVVPGDMPLADVRAMLSSPSSAGAWQIASIHPGHTSGLFRAWDVLAKWTGRQASISDVPDLTYAGKFVWQPDTPGAQPTSTPDNTIHEVVIVGQPSTVATYVAGAGVLGAIGFGLGWLLFRA